MGGGGVMLWSIDFVTERVAREVRGNFYHSGKGEGGKNKQYDLYGFLMLDRRAAREEGRS